MVKIVNILEIYFILGFIEFDILEKYCKSFNESEFGKFYLVFLFECMVKVVGLLDWCLGCRNRFSFFVKIVFMVLKVYIGFFDR